MKREKKPTLLIFLLFSLTLSLASACSKDDEEPNPVNAPASPGASVPEEDIPAPGDYDGDGKTDVAVWHRGTHVWEIKLSSNAPAKKIQWGIPSPPENDVAVPADYDGDGKTDVAVWRRQTGVWWIQKSSDGQTLTIQWGEPKDTPLPGDYDGDKKADAAVWREGVLLIKLSADGKTLAK